MNNAFKRLLSFALALALILSMTPTFSVTAEAATLTGLTDTSIVLSGTTSDWTVGSNSLNGTKTGTRLTTTVYLFASTTLTIKNNKSSAATLSFDFTASGAFAQGGYVTIDGTKYTAATTSSYSKELAAGSSITVLLYCGASRSGANTMNLAISNLSLVVEGVTTTTFQAPDYGSYTVAYGTTTETVSAGAAAKEISNDSSVQYTMTVNPGSGNKLIGWYNVTTGQYISTDTTYTAQFDSPNTIKPIVVPNTTAVFLVGNNNYFTDLDDAVNYATANSQTQVTLVSSGTISDASYTIPSGITLLIPKDTAYTPMGDEPEYSESATTPSAFLTLTLAANTKITVNGTVEAEAAHTSLQGANAARPYGGRVSGKYGAIYMNSGSSITLNSGANLFAWGYVYGSGSVTANSGANVYEYMQVTDFPGGSNLSGFVDTDGNDTNDALKAFPFSQYYVQNIEVPLTLYYGATEYVYATVTVSDYNIGMPIEFIGDEGMFIMGSGSSLVKDYDPSTDRLIVDVNGNATLSSIVLDMSSNPLYGGIISLVLGTAKFDSSGYILNLNSNITINVNSGTTTVGQDVALLPGVEVYVDQGAALHISEGDSSKITVMGSGGRNVYVYDKDQWGSYVFSGQQLMAASYSPTSGRYKRTAADLKDVIIDVNGTITTDGFLYTTVTVDAETWLPIGGGASIISSEGTGKVVMNNGAGMEFMAYQLDGTSAAETVIDIASAWLKNGDGSYVETADAVAGDAYVYNATSDKWEKLVDATITYDANGGTAADGITTTTQTVSKDDIAAGSKTVLNTNTFSREGYEFLGWNTDKNATTALYADGAEVSITSDTTLYAIWEVQKYFIYIEDDYLDSDETAPAYDDGEVQLTYGETITDEMLGTPEKGGYTFTGWLVSNGVDGIEQPTKMPAFDVYYLAQWEKNAVIYTLTFLDEIGTVLGEYEYEEGATVTATYPTYTKDGYTITWSAEIPATMTSDLEISAVATALPVHTLSFLDDNGTVLASYDYYVGQNITATAPNYTKQCHTITWSAEIPKVMPDKDLEIGAIATAKHTAGETVIENNVDATCTTGGSYESVVYCSVCNTELSRETGTTEAAGHQDGEAVVENKVNATCTADGSYDTVVYCTVCSKELSRETITIEANGHTAGEAVIENEVAATCTADGSFDTATYCTVCGTETSRKTTTVPTNGHTAGAAVVENEVAADCDTAGSYDSVVYCSVCNHEINRETLSVPATGEHIAKPAVVENEIAATCTADGSYDTVVYCSDCGYEISRKTTTVSATGHTAAEPVEENKVAATCTTDGSYDTVVYCSVCGDEISRVTTTVLSTGHTAAEPVEENKVAATCITDGSYDTVVYCSVCDGEISRQTVTVPATGHSAGDEVIENNVGATCTTDGSYDTVTYCTVCGVETSRATTTVAATGHAAGKTVVENNVDATCTTDGSYDNVVYCTVCDAELSCVTVPVPATGHTAGEAVTENEVAADCENPGSYDTVVYCTVCDAELSRVTTPIAALGHTAGAAATCTTAQTCTVCGETLVAALGHTAGAAVKENEVAADCENPGSYDTVVYCSGCGEELSRDTTTVTAKGHNPGKPVRENRVEADCVNPGSYENVIYCTVCGEEWSRTTIPLNPIGHNPAAAVTENEVAADCENPGSYDTVVYCTVCGDEISRETVTVAALGHTPGAVADCENAQSCTECGDVLEAAKGHAWGDPSYTVNGDGTHTANYVCSNDASHTKSDPAEPHKYTNGVCVCGQNEIFILTLDYNGGSSEVGSAWTIGVAYENEIAAAFLMNQYPPVREGHTLLGYTTVKDDASTLITNEAPFTMPAENTSVYALWQTNTYKLTMSQFINFMPHDPFFDEYVAYGTNIGALDAVKNLPQTDYRNDNMEIGKIVFDGWFDAIAWAEVEDLAAVTMPAKDSAFYAMYVFTGWQSSDSGKNWAYWTGTDYLVGWAEVNEADYTENGTGTAKYYFVDMDGEGWYVRVTDITEIDGVLYAFDHDTGKFLSDYTGIYEAENGDLYYVENGIAVANKGLVQVDDPAVEGGHLYYYFGCGANNCSAAPCNGEYKAQVSNRHYAAITNGYLIEGGFTTGEDGIIEHIADTTYEGIYEIDGVKYYLMDGVKVHKGLIKVGGYYYYARSSGALAVNTSYWVSAGYLNGYDLTPGSYMFDEEGRIIFEEAKNGFYFENGAWYYYVDGKLNYAGLIQSDGPEGGDPGLYYVNSKGMLVTDCGYWISKNNGLVERNKTYYFDENGTMYEPVVETPEVKEGFYFENGAWYYYVDGKLNYAGLIQSDGPEGGDPGLYYVNSKGMLITGCDYWISKNNGNVERNKTYTFDENGTMVIPEAEEVKNGFYYENDAWYYYVDGKLNYAGLIWSYGPTGDDYGLYYVNSKYMLITDCEYWISKNNGNVERNKLYTFDENGTMVTE